MGFFRTVHAVGIQYIPMIITFLNYFFFTKLNFGFFLEVGFALRVKESKVTLHVCVAFSASVSPLNHVIIQAQLLACYIEQNIYKFLHVLGGWKSWRKQPQCKVISLWSRALTKCCRDARSVTRTMSRTSYPNKTIILNVRNHFEITRYFYQTKIIQILISF